MCEFKYYSGKGISKREHTVAQEPLISIIIPIYNAQSYIERCVKSIQSQCFNNYEILLIDDGSTDDSAKKCDYLSLDDNRIKTFHKSNGGVSSARNLGLDKASGNWILFCDADDELLPNSLQHFVDAITENIDFIMADYIEEPYTKLPEISSSHFSNLLNSNKFLFKEYYGRYGGYIWNKIFKKEIIDKVHLRFDEGIYYNEDRLFIFQYLSYISHDKHYINLPVYKYYKSSSSAMASIEGLNFWKFETDLDAFIKINIIASGAKSKSLIKLVKKGAFNSYRKNIQLNRKFGQNNRERNIRLKEKINTVLDRPYILWNDTMSIISFSLKYPLKLILRWLKK